MPKIIIIGSGPCALGAAHRLNELNADHDDTKVIILEKNSVSGGLSSTAHDYLGYLWDLGGHVVFSHYNYFSNVLDKVVDEWEYHIRNANILFNENKYLRYVPYPLQKNLQYLSSKDKDFCLEGLKNRSIISDRSLYICKSIDNISGTSKKTFQDDQSNSSKDLSPIKLKKEISHGSSIECPSGINYKDIDGDNKSNSNFEQWILNTMGKGIYHMFMKPYNNKVWSVDPSEMSSEWIKEKVAIPDYDKILINCKSDTPVNTIKYSKKHIIDTVSSKDDNWGPNNTFRFPRYGGTGNIWEKVTESLPRAWFYYNNEVIKINMEQRNITIKNNLTSAVYQVKYDVLINTMPLNKLVEIIEDETNNAKKIKAIARKLRYNTVHVIGVGIKGEPPKHLRNKTWIYFPGKDIPFYRITIFSNYSKYNVPSGYWSLLCESATPPGKSFYSDINLENRLKMKEELRKNIIPILIEYGLVDEKSLIHNIFYRKTTC